MSYVTIEEFDAYSGNFDDDAVRVSLKETYLDAAETIVSDYLGYDPVLQSYVDIFDGLGGHLLQLNAKPINDITLLRIDGDEIDVSEVRPKKADSEWIFAKDIVFTKGIANIAVEYEAGFDPMPGAIKLCVLRIASLLLTESDGNIGITSKSFDNTSRTFYNFTNFSKYLTSIEKFKITRLE
jgi:hypothetical protein